MSYRTKKMVEEHKEALLLIGGNRFEIIRINQQQMKVGENFVTKLEENEYGVGMFCKSCELDLSIFSCDCHKYLV